MTTERLQFTPEPARAFSHARGLEAEHVRAREGAPDPVGASGNGSLQGAAANPRAAQEAIRRTLRELGHEMRGPLNAIALSLELLKRAPPGPEQAQPIGAIARQLELLSRLADDLFHTAESPAGHERLWIRTVDLNEAARLALETCRAYVEDRCHRILTLYAAHPLLVEADATRLRQVIINLVDNAAKYTPPYGRICVTTAREGDVAALRIRDNGIGIVPEKLKRIFDPFVQLSDPRAQQRGIGLGLTLVKKWLTMHGGTVKVYSEGADLGSEFVVRLPLAPGGKAQLAGVQAQLHEGCAESAELMLHRAR